MNATPEMCVDLLRHGEAEGGDRFRGSTDDPLTPHGWAQMAAALGDDCTWDGIVSSPARRCADFARHLAHRHGISLQIEKRLREIHFGAWEGKRAADLPAADADVLARFWTDPAHHPPPGGESLIRFRTRVVDAWEALIERHAGERILLVSHGGAIRMILGHVLDIPLNRLPRIEVSHAAVSRVRLQRDAEGRLLPSLVFHAGRL